MTGPQQEVLIEYTNYRGDRSVRGIRPIAISFGNNEWHPERQWLLEAFDLTRDQVRMFAMKNIHSWKEVR
jgi:predicted DNA-binding transcriptional regulator YafY